MLITWAFKLNGAITACTACELSDTSRIYNKKKMLFLLKNLSFEIFQILISSQVILNFLWIFIVFVQKEDREGKKNTYATQHLKFLMVNQALWINTTLEFIKIMFFAVNENFKYNCFFSINIRTLIKKYHDWCYKKKTTTYINSAFNLFQISPLLKPHIFVQHRIHWWKYFWKSFLEIASSYLVAFSWMSSTSWNRVPFK